MMELSNAVSRYLFERSKAAGIIRGHDHIPHVSYAGAVSKESEGVLQLVFYLVKELCQSVGALWGLYCAPYE